MTDRVWTCARGLFLVFADEKLSGLLAKMDLEPALVSVTKRDGERDIALDDRDARVGRAPTSMSLDKVHRDVLLPLSHNLKTEGYVVESVDRGDGAVRKLADAPPDLVILDWKSSGMSGPRNLYPVARVRRDTNAAHYHALHARGGSLALARLFRRGG